MMTHAVRTTIVLLMALASPGAFGDALVLEAGNGVLHSDGTVSWFARYRFDIDSSPSAVRRYLELDGGAWHGTNYNRAAGVGIGTYFTLTADVDLDGGIGLFHIETEDNHLGTHTQIQLRVALMSRHDAYRLHLGLVHISNGNKAAEWNGFPNVGENFLTVGITRLF